MQIRGKTALVTGAGRGIGQQLCWDLAAKGAHIVAADLHDDAMVKTVTKLHTQGIKVTTCAADVADSEAVARLIETMAAEAVDILVNCAGVLVTGDYTDLPFELVRKTIDINLVGTMHVCHGAIPILKQRPQAHIVNISSVAGVVPAGGMLPYVASKFGVTGFTRSLWLELKDTTIGVSCVHPSMVKTQMTTGVDHASWVRNLEPAEVAAAVITAIERDRPDVFVPSSMRLVMEVVPRLLPRFARWLIAKDRTAEGYRAAKKNTAAK